MWSLISVRGRTYSDRADSVFLGAPNTRGTERFGVSYVPDGHGRGGGAASTHRERPPSRRDSPPPGVSGRRIRAAVARQTRHHRPMLESHTSALTPRLEVRCPIELDRPRFVELFSDDAFMTFSGGSLAADQAHARFDRMLARCAEFSFAKQAIVERCSGVVIGYTGVDWIEFDGGRWLEWGYQLVPAARGKGYATEASLALLEVASHDYAGKILGIIHPENRA